MIPEEIIRKVLGAVDSDELVNLTSDLVKINTVWDPLNQTNEQPAAEYLFRWAQNQGFEVQQEEVAAGRPNVIVTWRAGSGERRLMFEGHTDVVTPGDLSAWNYDPFGAQIVDRCMYGRGTNDTKGNLAAMLIAMAAVKNSDVQLSGTIVGGILCDEEDQMLGVRDFIAKGHADKITGAVICEPQDGLICITQKGALRARFTVKGRMSHGAMPLSGLNIAPAIAQLIKALHKLELQAAERPGRDELLGWPSFTPTVIQAPSAGVPQFNVMPGEARLLVDIRTTPSQSHQEIIKDLEDMRTEVEQQVRLGYVEYDESLGVERSHDLKITLEILTDRPCTVTDPDDPVVLAADWATRRVSGKGPTYAGVPGATDGTFLWALKNIPIVTMGVGDREVAHQADEWVNLDQLIDTAKIYALTALHYLWPGDVA